MSLNLPALRVGEPIRHNTLSVFPLFSGSRRDVGYRLSEEAFADQSIVVEDSPRGDQASALVFDEAVIHGSLVATA